MDRADSRPSVVAPCKHCSTDTVWLQMAYGGWRLFDAEMYPTEESAAGNRFAIRRSTRQVIDLEDEHEARWPVKCPQLHRFRCPASHDDTLSSISVGRANSNDIDLEGLWRRLAERKELPAPGRIGRGDTGRPAGSGTVTQLEEERKDKKKKKKKSTAS